MSSSNEVLRLPVRRPVGLLRLLWARPSAAVPPVSWRVVATVLIVAGAAATAWSGVVHLKLWHEDNGYAQVAVVGKLFLLQGIGCLILALGAIVLRRFAVVIAGAALMASSVGGLVLSLRGELFGYHEFSDSPYVVPSLVLESAAVVAFVASFVIALVTSRSSA